ncbi:MAG: DNA primase, partial [Yaniella sp.]|nr:DNA primase [Yaniella sp.]
RLACGTSLTHGPALTHRDQMTTRRGLDVQRLGQWVAALGEGERNLGLFWAACRLAENNTAVGDTLAVLGPAAAHAGLGAREITTTIRSAYRTTDPAYHRSTSDEPAPRRSPPQPAVGRVIA